MGQNSLKTVALVVAILLLQFVTVPGLGDIDKAGKLFVFVFAVLFVAYRFISRASQLEFSRVSAAFILLWAIFLISAAQAVSPGWAFIPTLIFAAIVIYLLLITDFSVNHPQFLNCLSSALLLFGLLAALLGLYEYFHFALTGPRVTMLIPFLLPPDLSIRVVGMYGQPNLFALFLSVVLLAYGYRYLHLDRKTALRHLSPLRFLPFFVVALVFFLTGSRAGLLSLSLIWGFLLWLVASRRYLIDDVKGRKELYCLVGCLVFALLASKGLNEWLLGSGASGRSFSAVGINSDERFVHWTNAALIFLDNPWFGVGLDNYGFLQDAYGPLSHTLLGFVPYEAMVNTDYAHNELLQILCEGGLFAFCLLLFLLLLLLWKIRTNFIARNTQFSSVFLYSHLFLLPFIFQSMFSWPMRSPPLLVLFFTFLGGLLSQYSVKTIRFSPGSRKIMHLFLLLGVSVTVILFYQEIRIGAFKRSFSGNHQIETTLDDFNALVNHPYSSYRVLNKALTVYSNEALKRKDASLAEKILPYYEQVTKLEGARWQWYNLARLYLKVGRDSEAKVAIQRAIDLMPADELPWAFQHYLNMLSASRETGRPLESFFPRGKKIDFNVRELMRD